MTKDEQRAALIQYVREQHRNGAGEALGLLFALVGVAAIIVAVTFLTPTIANWVNPPPPKCYVLHGVIEATCPPNK